MAAKKLFVNLPVKNLDKSKDFFAKLWFDGHAFQDADGLSQPKQPRLQH